MKTEAKAVSAGRVVHEGREATAMAVTRRPLQLLRERPEDKGRLDHGLT